MSLLNFLQSFHKISTKDYDFLVGHFKEKSFRKGEMMVNEGEVQKEIYFINAGVQMSYYEKGNKLHVVAFTYPPNICGIPESFMLQQPARYFLTCISDTQAYALSYAQLNSIFEQSQQIERLFRKMTEAVLTGVIARHIELHALSMEERFKAFTQRSPQLLQLVPHKYIASYLGIDPTNFSKLYNSVKI